MRKHALAAGAEAAPAIGVPDGQCVGWDAFDRICGKPPTTRCKAELVNSEKPPKEKALPK